MAARRHPPPHSNKIGVMVRIDRDLYEAVRVEAASKHKPISSIVEEKLSRDTLLNEIRTIIREELGK